MPSAPPPHPPASRVPPSPPRGAERAGERWGDRYPAAITPEMAALIEGDPARDPIGMQFLPDPSELDIAPGESDDPIGDRRLSPVKGIVHRYPDRVLLKPTLLCPVYCRFCFRREDVGPKGGGLTARELEVALDY